MMLTSSNDRGICIDRAPPNNSLRTSSFGSGISSKRSNAATPPSRSTLRETLDGDLDGGVAVAALAGLKMFCGGTLKVPPGLIRIGPILSTRRPLLPLPFLLESVELIRSNDDSALVGVIEESYGPTLRPQRVGPYRALQL